MTDAAPEMVGQQHGMPRLGGWVDDGSRNQPGTADFWRSGARAIALGNSGGGDGEDDKNACRRVAHGDDLEVREEMDAAKSSEDAAGERSGRRCGRRRRGEYQKRWESCFRGYCRGRFTVARGRLKQIQGGTNGGGTESGWEQLG